MSFNETFRNLDDDSCIKISSFIDCTSNKKWLKNKPCDCFYLKKIAIPIEHVNNVQSMQMFVTNFSFETRSDEKIEIFNIPFWIIKATSKITNDKTYTYFHFDHAIFSNVLNIYEKFITNKHVIGVVGLIWNSFGLKIFASSSFKYKLFIEQLFFGPSPRREIAQNNCYEIIKPHYKYSCFVPGKKFHHLYILTIVTPKIICLEKPDDVKIIDNVKLYEKNTNFYKIFYDGEKYLGVKCHDDLGNIIDSITWSVFCS